MAEIDSHKHFSEIQTRRYCQALSLFIVVLVTYLVKNTQHFDEVLEWFISVSPIFTVIVTSNNLSREAYYDKHNSELHWLTLMLVVALTTLFIAYKDGNWLSWLIKFIAIFLVLTMWDKKMLKFYEKGDKRKYNEIMEGHKLINLPILKVSIILIIVLLILFALKVLFGFELLVRFFDRSLVLEGYTDGIKSMNYSLSDYFIGGVTSFLLFISAVNYFGNVQLFKKNNL